MGEWDKALQTPDVVWDRVMRGRTRCCGGTLWSERWRARKPRAVPDGPGCAENIDAKVAELYNVYVTIRMT